MSGNATDDNQLLRDQGYRGPILNIINNFNMEKNNKLNEDDAIIIRNNAMCEVFKEDVKIVSLEQLNESFLDNNIKQYGDVFNNSEEKNIILNKLKDKIAKGSGLYMRKYLCTIYTASLDDMNRY